MLVIPKWLSSKWVSNTELSQHLNVDNVSIFHCILPFLLNFFSELEITPSIRILPNAVVVEGDRVHIICNVSDYSQSGLEVFLTKDTVLHKDHRTFSHSFVVTANDSGEYVCKTEKGNVQKISKAQLQVAGNYPYAVTMSYTWYHQVTKIGSAFSCNSSKTVPSYDTSTAWIRLLMAPTALITLTSFTT